MQTRMKDMREIGSIQDAKGVFDELARVQLSLEKADAAFELKVAKMKTDHVEKTYEACTHLSDLVDQLITYIEANQGQFVNPRKVKTDFGSFGLQTVTDLVVPSEAALIKEVHDLGPDFQGCIQTTIKPVKKAIAEHIAAGMTFLACSIRTGNTAVYTVKKALVDEARVEVSDV